jgi:hypothetical protein
MSNDTAYTVLFAVEVYIGKINAILPELQIANSKLEG